MFLLQAAQPSKPSGDTGTAEMPQDVLHLFKETQRNLLDLNKSRLAALDDLHAAHSRIAELGEQLRCNTP